MTSAAFGPGGGLLVTTGANETARIWRVLDGRLLHELKGHRSSVARRRLQSAWRQGRDRERRRHRTDLGRAHRHPDATIGGHRGIVEAVAFSPDGNFVVTGSADRTAQTSKADDGTPRALLAGHGDPVHTVEYSPDGARVLTASDDGTARLWDVAVQPQLQLVRQTVGPLEEAEYVGAGDRIIAAGPGRQALVLRADDGRVVDSIVAKAPVTAVASSMDGELLAAAAGRVLILRRSDGETESILHREKVTSVAFAPDGRRIATGGKRGSATIWSVDGEKLAELDGHSAEITDVAFSADGHAWRRRRGTRPLASGTPPPADSFASSLRIATMSRRLRSAPTEGSCSPRAGTTMRACGMRTPERWHRFFTGTSARSPTRTSAPTAVGSLRRAQ